jgi:hypothetical protein
VPFCPLLISPISSLPSYISDTLFESPWLEGNSLYIGELSYRNTHGPHARLWKTMADVFLKKQKTKRKNVYKIYQLVYRRFNILKVFHLLCIKIFTFKNNSTLRSILRKQLVHINTCSNNNNLIISVCLWLRSRVGASRLAKVSKRRTNSLGNPNSHLENKWTSNVEGHANLFWKGTVGNVVLLAT